MKYIIETNADNGDTFYSRPFDTIEKAVEEMAYQWRLLPSHVKSEIMKRNYTGEDGWPYMIVLEGMTEKTTGIFMHTDWDKGLTLAQMIEAQENEEEED